jgi:precorrin-6A/cobalt-precorrin-6A reductase
MPMIDNQGSAMRRVLVLGGTTEASLLARALADAGIDGVFSYAGRTEAPLAQPLPHRVGGFGGIDGLVSYLRTEAFTHVVDATHPFAAQMSRHAIAACTETGVPLIALERQPWTPGPQDNWTRVSDVQAAVAALPDAPCRIFLAIGRQHLEDFAAKPQHHYLLRIVDPPRQPLPLPRATALIARGPFAEADDLALMTGHAIQLIVAKNAGGVGARAKLDAARTLQLPVIMIDRPAVPERARVETVAEVLAWLHHSANLGV